MRKIKILISLLFMFTVVAMAQQKKYVSYPVKKGETMKKIAKRLDISTRTLLKLNPGIKRRPTPNTIIIIPNKNFGLVVDNKNISQNTYVVKAKETWYGIAKKHSVSIAALKAKNPTINELAIGAELQIPVVEITTLNVEEKYQLHTVVKDDTIYNLTKLYGLSKTELLQMNPALKEGLKLGMVLKIRVLNVENIPENLPLFEENLDFEKTINIALMLPYNLYKLTDSIRNKSFEKPTSLLNIATDFHLGTSMAIDSLRAKGLEINVQYFDTENSKEKLQYLVNTHNFNAYDAVIGPLYFDKAYWVSNQINTPVIAPVYSKTQTSISADNLIKSAPKAQVFEEKLLSYIERNYKGENIVIINDEKPTSQIKLQRVLARLNKFNTQKNISVVIPENDYIERDTLMPRVKDSIHNTVLLITNDVVTTAAAVNYLKLFMADHDIVFYAFNKGKNFDNIDNDFLGRLNFVFATNTYLDIENALVKNFYKAYQEKNHTLPTKYAIRGFDIMYDALVRIASHTYFYEGLQAGISSRVSAIFNYLEKPLVGFENNGVLLIQYNKDLLPVVLE